MSGIYGNDPFDQYWEKELDKYLDSLDDDYEYDYDSKEIRCKECGNLNSYGNYSILEEDEEQYLVCPSCDHTIPTLT